MEKGKKEVQLNYELLGILLAVIIQGLCLAFKIGKFEEKLDTLEKKIEKYGSIETSNKGNVRESIYYKTYLQSINVYQSIIRTLNTIMGKNVVDPDDEFDEFMSKLNG